MRNLKSLLWAVCLVLVTTAGAYAVPRSDLETPAPEVTPSESPAPDVDGQEVAEEHRSEKAAEKEAKAHEAEDEAETEEEGGSTGHGEVVSAAAHCDVHGRAHGELVSGVAHDESATVESVEAACAAAIATQEAEGETHGAASEEHENSGQKGEHGPPDHSQANGHSKGVSS